MAGVVVALAALAAWVTVLTLAGDDVPFVPPAVEMGNPPVTVAPAVPDQSAPGGGAESSGDGRTRADRERAVAVDSPTASDDQDRDADGGVPESDDGAPESSRERPARALVVAPEPVRVGGDAVTQTPRVTTTSIPTRPTRPTPQSQPSSTTTVVPRAPSSPPTSPPSSTPTTSVPSPALPMQVPVTAPVRDHGEGVASCSVPEAPGLEQARERTVGTPASPPPRGHGWGCGAIPDRGEDVDRSNGAELKAVREQDEDDRDRAVDGRSRGTAGRGRPGAGD